MKSVHLCTIAIIICGLMLTVESVCEIAACSPGVSCSTLNDQISCLETESSGCTESDTNKKNAIDLQKSVAVTARNALPGCSGAASVSVSMVTVFLAAAATFLKS